MKKMGRPQVLSKFWRVMDVILFGFPYFRFPPVFLVFYNIGLESYQFSINTCPFTPWGGGGGALDPIR